MHAASAMLPRPPGACLLGVQGVQARDDAVGGRAELIIARARAERAELHLRAQPAPTQRGALTPGAGPGPSDPHGPMRVRAARAAACLCGPFERPHTLARTPRSRALHARAQCPARPAELHHLRAAKAGPWCGGQARNLVRCPHLQVVATSVCAARPFLCQASAQTSRAAAGRAGPGQA